MPPAVSPDAAVTAAKAASLPKTPVRHPSLKQRMAVWLRWLHIYGSMLGLVALLFFSVTGLTLNHPDWLFGTARSEVQGHGQLRLEWLSAESMESRRLEIVEHLRSTHRVRGHLDAFEVEEAECMISFKSPGQSADVFVNRRTGAYEITQVSEGLVAIMNDFHKGRHAGTAWKWVIDISAILLAVISLTGLGLLLYIKRRRRNGLIITGVGAAVLVILWCL